MNEEKPSKAATSVGLLHQTEVRSGVRVVSLCSECSMETYERFSSFFPSFFSFFPLHVFPFLFIFVVVFVCCGRGGGGIIAFRTLQNDQRPNFACIAAVDHKLSLCSVFC